MPRDDGFAMTWFVKVDGRVYGPYTAAQMRAFIGEGRIAAHSEVSEDREDGWREASEIDQFVSWMDEARQSPDRRRGPDPDARTANFVVIAEIEQDGLEDFNVALGEYGDVEPISRAAQDGDRFARCVWLMRAASSAAMLRNELSHILGRDDRLLIVDASRDRTAWFNLGREADQRIRSLWGRPQ